jgi:hypothetical protein
MSVLKKIEALTEEDDVRGSMLRLWQRLNAEPPTELEYPMFTPAGHVRYDVLMDNMAMYPVGPDTLIMGQSGDSNSPWETEARHLSDLIVEMLREVGIANRVKRWLTRHTEQPNYGRWDYAGFTREGGYYESFRSWAIASL